MKKSDLLKIVLGAMTAFIVVILLLSKLTPTLIELAKFRVDLYESWSEALKVTYIIDISFIHFLVFLGLYILFGVFESRFYRRIDMFFSGSFAISSLLLLPLVSFNVQTFINLTSYFFNKV